MFSTGWSLLFTMKACGHTTFMISCRTNSEAADVLMLKPARSSSSAMVAVPPDDDALVDAPLAVGATTMIDTDSAAAAMAAKADRFTYPLSRIVLPCSVGRPGDGRRPASSALPSAATSTVNVGRWW